MGEKQRMTLDDVFPLINLATIQARLSDEELAALAAEVNGPIQQIGQSEHRRPTEITGSKEKPPPGPEL